MLPGLQPLDFRLKRCNSCFEFIYRHCPIPLGTILSQWTKAHKARLPAAKMKPETNSGQERRADCSDGRAADVVAFAGEVLERAKHFDALS